MKMKDRMGSYTKKIPIEKHRLDKKSKSADPTNAQIWKGRTLTDSKNECTTLGLRHCARKVSKWFPAGKGQEAKRLPTPAGVWNAPRLQWTTTRTMTSISPLAPCTALWGTSAERNFFPVFNDELGGYENEQRGERERRALMKACNEARAAGFEASGLRQKQLGISKFQSKSA